mgnify:CR=1 FL=1
MRFAVVNGDVIQYFLQSGNDFILNGIQYPSNWLQLSDVSQREALGIYPVNEATTPDQRFYWTGNETYAFDATNKVVNATITATPKELDGLKNVANSQIISTAYSMLAPTDWYVSRYVDSNTAIPENVSVFRPAIRERSKVLRTSVAVANTVNDIIALYTNVDANTPAPINDWPKLNQ